MYPQKNLKYNKFHMNTPNTNKAKIFNEINTAFLSAELS